MWPVAIYDRIVARDEASAWYRFHMRQALWFGALSALIGLAAFTWPLVASILIANISATIWIYALAGLADVTLFVIWLVLAMRYSQRASRGELFDVPWVSRLTKRWSTPT